MLVRLGSLISGNIELTPRPIARMAKSADAADLKSADRKVVGVQVPLRAPNPATHMGILLRQGTLF